VIQIALSFIGIKVGETDRVEIDEEDATDSCPGPWEDERVPQGGFDPRISAEGCVSGGLKRLLGPIRQFTVTDLSTKHKLFLP
jgi:hypothetical protein